MGSKQSSFKYDSVQSSKRSLKKSSNHSHMLNVYDEPLQPCRENNLSNSGSWDNDGYCSELTGGVHQICMKDISNNSKGFSKITGQSNWSDNRNGENHCACVGAFGLYTKKKNNLGTNVIKCDAIPKDAFSKKNIKKWKKWNGLEIDGQEISGIDSLFNICYEQADGDLRKQAGLIDNYYQHKQNRKN